MTVVAQTHTRRTAEETRRALFGRPPARRGSFAITQPFKAGVRSAALETLGQKKAEGGGGSLRRSPDIGWQSEALSLADTVGELGYLLSLKADVVAECLLTPQMWDPAEREWLNCEDVEVGGVEALAVMARFTSPHPDGQKGLKRRAAYLLACCGEAYLLGSPDDDAFDGELEWEFVSVEEIVFDSDGSAQRRRDGSTREAVGDDVFSARCWKSSPRFSDLATSEVKRNLEVLREIVVLGQVVEAIARSRIPAGIMYIADELTFTGEDEADEADGGDVDDIDRFTRLLIDHLSTPLEDRRSASSVVPLVVRGPSAIADQAIRLIDLSRNLDVFLQDLRKEALVRMACGLDTPPEVIGGKSQLNHWTSLNVDADFLVKHVNPLGGLLAEFMGFSYLRPMLEAEYGMTKDESRRYRVLFDLAPVTARQDSAAAAERLHDKMLVSDTTTRNEAGFTDADAPNDDELFQRRAYELILSNPVVFASQLLPKVHGFEWVNPAELAATSANAPAPSTPPSSNGNQPIVDQSSGQEEPQSQPPGFVALQVRVATAADAAYVRARDRAVARLLTGKPGRDTVIRDRLGTTRDGRGLAQISPDDLRRVGVTPAALLRGSWDQFSRDVARWIRQHLDAEGFDGPNAANTATVVTQAICDSLDEYAAAHLLEPAPCGVDGLRVPSGLVTQHLAALYAIPVG